MIRNHHDNLIMKQTFFFGFSLAKTLYHTIKVLYMLRVNYFFEISYFILEKLLFIIDIILYNCSETICFYTFMSLSIGIIEMLIL